ncbi:MAG: type I-U CRISPR-associated protein Cas5/Cas6 [Acidobacteria bacterium]|nr:type I-U CRISPR-associated protein Cas5/Cas6 [Acidobacteriota bacterium]
MSTLVISVRLHDGRYHGVGDWPPAPARLFQALVAGAGLGGPLTSEAEEALRWLEARGDPVIAAPLAWRSRGVPFYMPNNDSDRVAGDPLRMAEICTATKVFNPYLFDPEVPLLYVWSLAGSTEDEQRSPAICRLAEQLYQLGRGIDMAWGWGEVLNGEEVEARLSGYPGRIYRPSAGQSRSTLACPMPKSLDSVEKRYQAFAGRFQIMGKGKAAKVVFRQPPRPRFRPVPYESPPASYLYALRKPTREAPFAAWPLARTSALVVRLRDGALERLCRVMPPARRGEIDRVLVGRKPDGTNDGPTADRVRILPLPSIGHPHADGEIRRVLVQVPPTCPIAAGDVDWAFSGLDVADAETGEVHAVLTPADGDGFARHYGIGDDLACRTWRTVTPAALPEVASRRRVDPARRAEDAKHGRERAAEQARAAVSIGQALRHAGVRGGVDAIRVQREPFEANGQRAESFAEGTRFAKERLWHVQITFGAKVLGPLVIGDGRFLGLGVMAPVSTTPGLHVLAVESGLVATPDPVTVARALRRAVMARVQEALGTVPLPTFFSGHDRGGSPARSERSSHVAFTFDPARSRLLIAAPHVLDRRYPTSEERDHLTVLDDVLENLVELRAGSAGRLVLRSDWLDLDADVLTAPSRTWESVAPYWVTRHAKKTEATEALSADLRAECRRRGLPEPVEVRPLEVRGVPSVGLVGRARLVFAVAVRGPILLGRTRYIGGGLFTGTGRMPRVSRVVNQQG